MRYKLLTWYAFNVPSRAWMVLPRRVRSWWAQQWINERRRHAR